MALTMDAAMSQMSQLRVTEAEPHHAQIQPTSMRQRFGNGPSTAMNTAAQTARQQEFDQLITTMHAKLAPGAPAVLRKIQDWVFEIGLIPGHIFPQQPSQQDPQNPSQNIHYWHGKKYPTIHPKLLGIDRATREKYLERCLTENTWVIGPGEYSKSLAFMASIPPELRRLISKMHIEFSFDDGPDVMYYRPNGTVKPNPKDLRQALTVQPWMQRSQRSHVRLLETGSNNDLPEPLLDSWKKKLLHMTSSDPMELNLDFSACRGLSEMWLPHVFAKGIFDMSEEMLSGARIVGVKGVLLRRSLRGILEKHAVHYVDA
ncbi:MAG: hypothetical protein Q9168_003226 [Polycauliona sp. 1 TL-2023]